MSNFRVLSTPPVPRLRDALRDSSLFGRGAITVARAPGRLDVMGGIADYSGSRVCEMPLDLAAAAAVQTRTDDKIFVRTAQIGSTLELPAQSLRDSDAKTFRSRIADDQSWARYVAGCMWWLVARRGVEPSGVSILVDSDVPLGGGVSSSAALEVATMTALSTAFAVNLSPMELAAACQYVENHVVGAPCGVMDQVTSALGEESKLVELLCQPDAADLPAQLIGFVTVPRGYAFIGIHSGVRHEVSGDPYTDTRVAAFMGQKILATRFAPRISDVHLANIPRAAYTSDFRNDLPVTMRGRDFIAQFGRTNDAVTTVKPETTYAVQAATDHHVYEMERVTRFVELLKGRIDDAAMREAGELMYASHASYGDCAKLGHAMTDRIVAMVRQLGPQRGFFGAKITGGGCGGTVAILIRDEPTVRNEVALLRERYEKETGRRTMFFSGSSPGAAPMGTVTISFEELR